jgi:hypothetical protein
MPMMLSPSPDTLALCGAPDGSSPYRDWFDGFDAQAAAKVTTAKLRMDLGNTSNVRWFAGIGEYVIDRAKSLHAEYKKRKR